MVNHAAVRTQRAAARTWRMRAWPSDATVAHLIFVDHQQLPTADQLETAVRHAVRKGARAIRTSAMFPDAAEVALRWGFAPIDRLALLRRRLTAGDPSTQRRPTVHRVAPLRPWHLTACARIDREAFGLLWGNTPASLRDIRHATPTHRAQVVRVEHRIAGFVVCGAAGDTGYLQRLAVTPARRRTGIAVTLVRDSLDWMRRRGLRQAMVNTGTTNEAALGLYGSLGFVTLPDELTIAELDLT